MSDTLEKLQSDWETLARQPRYWKRGGNSEDGWTDDTFLRTGQAETVDMLGNLTRLFPALKPGNALDFGCGVGRLTEPLADMFDTVTGIDISAEQIRLAQERVQRPNVTFQVNAAADLAAYESDSFDLVYAHVVFQHMRPELTFGYLTEFARVLRPGGVACFDLPSQARLTPGGVAYTVLPKWAVNALKMGRDRVLMEMNPVSHEVLAPWLETQGFAAPVLQPSASAGKNWTAFRYFAQKA